MRLILKIRKIELKLLKNSRFVMILLILKLNLDIYVFIDNNNHIENKSCINIFFIKISIL